MSKHYIGKTRFGNILPWIHSLLSISAIVGLMWGVRYLILYFLSHREEELASIAIDSPVRSNGSVDFLSGIVNNDSILSIILYGLTALVVVGWVFYIILLIVGWINQLISDDYKR